MRIIGIMGSPRKNGNTDILLKKVMEGAETLNAETSIVYVNDLNIRGCQGCDKCKKAGHCILEDDMQQIYEEINKSDVVIFASPNYLGQMTAQTKLVYDRLYAYAGNGVPLSKKVGIIMVQRQPNDSLYSKYVNFWMGYLKYFFAGDKKILIAAGLEHLGDATKNSDYMKTAFEMGQEFVHEYGK